MRDDSSKYLLTIISNKLIVVFFPRNCYFCSISAIAKCRNKIGIILNRALLTNLPSFHQYLMVGSAQVLRLLFLRQICVVILFTWVDWVDFRDRTMWKLFQKLNGLHKNSYFVHRYKKSSVVKTFSGKDGVCCVNACHPFSIKVGVGSQQEEVDKSISYST